MNRNMYKIIMVLGFCIFATLLTMAHGKMMSTTESYTHSATLRTGNVRVYWMFNDTHITFEVHGETTGWIGIGFSPNGAMTGADIFIGWVKNGQIKVTDRHGVGNSFPTLDPQQDIDVLGGAECDGWTMFKFSRQLAACEVDYDREISQNTQRFIWAWGDVDPTGDDVEPSHYHGTQRGAESMFLLQSGETLSGLPEGPTYDTFDIRMDKFEVPSEDTYYNCKIFEVPKLTKKHHIVKFEPIIQEGNELNVHHMLVYRCGNTMQDPNELAQDARCNVPNMQHFKTCSTVIADWAIGAGATIYPEDAGFSLGDEGDPVYIQIELHYDNPTEKSGIIDSSGIRFTYTDSIRKYDVGVVDIGVLVNGIEHFIPPGAEKFLSMGQCTANCFEDRMATAGLEGINIFSVLLHSHLAGKSMRLRHLRDGVELPYPAHDDHYDFNYQEARYLHPHLTLKPRDHLQMECVYNTKDRTEMTPGGLGTRQEMCVTFISYYPKIDLAHCFSSVPRKVSWSFFGVDADTAKLIPGSDPKRLESWRLPGADINATKTMLDHLNEYDWNPQSIKAFETFYNSMIHYELCVPSNASETTWNLVNVTEITSPYVEPLKTCTEPYLPLLQKTSVDKCILSDYTTSTPVVTTTSRANFLEVSILPSVAVMMLPFFLS